jgi:phytoene desaturase
VVYEKMLLLAEEQQLKKDGLHLTWGQVGGCQMFSIDSLLTLVKTTDYYEPKLSPCLSVYFGVDEFITIADNLAKSKLLLNPLKKEAALSC